MKDNDPSPFILIAEDNVDDQLLLQYTFKSAKLPNKFHIVNNGQEAIAWLKSSLEMPKNLLFPTPGLVVLDIQMPFKTGLEVLEWIRSEPAYATLPVVIMSGLHVPEVQGECSQDGRPKLFAQTGRLQRTHTIRR